jgi:hypothetical protein
LTTYALTPHSPAAAPTMLGFRPSSRRWCTETSTAHTAHTAHMGRFSGARRVDSPALSSAAAQPLFCRFSRPTASSGPRYRGFSVLSHDGCTAVCLADRFIPYERLTPPRPGVLHPSAEACTRLAAGDRQDSIMPIKHSDPTPHGGRPVQPCGCHCSSPSTDTSSR